MDAQLKAMMAATIYTASPTGTTGAGVTTWGTPASRAAWQEREDKVYDGPNGTQKRTTHILIVEASIDLADRVWLDGDARTDALARRPYAVDPIRGADGSVEHYEVRL